MHIFINHIAGGPLLPRMSPESQVSSIGPANTEQWPITCLPEYAHALEVLLAAPLKCMTTLVTLTTFSCHL